MIKLPPKNKPGFLALVFLVLLLVSVNAGITKAGNSSPISWTKEIRSLMDKGNMKEAAIMASKAAAYYETKKEAVMQAEFLALSAEALSSQGHSSKALESIEKALVLIKNTNSTKLHARILLLKGILLTNKMKTDEAAYCLETSLKMAKKFEDRHLESSILNSLGNMFSVNDNYEKAFDAYNKSAEMALMDKDITTGVNALLNSARILIDSGEYAKANALLEKALIETQKIDGERDKIYSLLSICDLSMKVTSNKNELLPDTNLEKKLPEIISMAIKLSSESNDHIAESYALGGLGKYHENRKNFSEALDLTYKGIIKAQIDDSHESLMRLHWQAARILNKTGKSNEAISEFEKTVYYIKKTKNDISEDCRSGKSTYKDIVGPVYLELIDLLLNKSSSSKNPTEKSSLLRKTLATLESLKTAEIQDYFKDGCITAMESKISSPDAVSKSTAVLYPVILKDRTELILSLAGEVEQATITVDSEKVSETINNFRSRLENSGNNYYKKDAEKLYEWFIYPIEKKLAEKNIKTIILVPDGPIRTIPMAALYDGKSFLIEKYSIVTTPGLTLTDPNALKKDRIRLLMAGLTESVQGFSALPNVAMEAEYLNSSFKGKILQNESFTSLNIEDTVEKGTYSIVHIATHGQFDKDPSKTFLLTFDGRLTLDDLDRLIKPSKYSENPVELLTLSACQTAVGDDKAALGLAGVAIKSGARCALASLWYIDDEATSKLLTNFYDELKKPEVSKAKAIQIAQVNLLRQNKFSHPAFWSSFLLIGNWL